MEGFRVNGQGRASGEGAGGTTKFSGWGLLLCMERQRAGGLCAHSEPWAMAVGFAEGTRTAEMQRAEDAEAGAAWSWKPGAEGRQVLEMRAGRAGTRFPEEHLIHFPSVRALDYSW